MTLLSDGRRLTGAYALGPEAGEWLQQATLAIRAHVAIEVMSDTIQPFPSFSGIYDATLVELCMRIADMPPPVTPMDAQMASLSTRGAIMTTETTPVPNTREPQLLGQTVVLIGGSAGIGLETARLARAEGADVVLAARDPERLERAALDVEARSTAAFDATDPAAVKRFFDELPGPIDHVLITGPGPQYIPLLEMTPAQVQEALSDHVVLGLEVARHAAGKMRSGGTLLLMGGTGGRRIGRDLGIASAATAALPPFVAALALELAPVRVNLIAAGFVDTPLSASYFSSEGLEARREELRATLPIGRVVGPADVAALAVHIMTNTALTGATYDIDGGQQFVR